MIPSNISRHHLIQAMEEIDKNGVPEDRVSTKYYVRHNGRHYPPKYLISIANKYANGKELEPLTFHGGDEANAPFFAWWYTRNWALYRFGTSYHSAWD